MAVTPKTRVTQKPKTKRVTTKRVSYSKKRNPSLLENLFIGKGKWIVVGMSIFLFGAIGTYMLRPSSADTISGCGQYSSSNSGTSSPCVKYLQRMINGTNYRTTSTGTGYAYYTGGLLSVDGYYGPKTKAAVIGFQKSTAANTAPLAVDGITGSKTWSALCYRVRTQQTNTQYPKRADAYAAGKSAGCQGTGWTTTSTATTTTSSTSKRYVFFVPHQDDESLSMGTAIAKAATASKDVRVVLFTDGTGSGARTGALCKEKKVCLTAAQFSVARNKEFVAALNKLGVTTANIYFHNQTDGASTSSTANAFVDKYIAKFGYNATYQTMSWLDAHPDHYNLGYSLNNRCENKKVASCKFLQSDFYNVGTSHSNPGVTKIATPSGSWQNPTGTEKTRVVSALNEYKRWDPANGRYSIGYISVPSSINYSIANPRDWAHATNSNWLSTGDRTKAAAWINKYQ